MERSSGPPCGTREGVKPVYIAQGQLISLDRALEFAHTASGGFRIPRPTRKAGQFVEGVKRN
jgi:deoxyinosine 3'endonuclease (endonuclease V)